MSARTRGHSRLSLRYFDDRILLTETHAWAYYRLPTQPYEFTTPADREALATNITVALAAIRMPDAEVHLRIVHHSYGGGGVGRAAGRHLGRRPGLAELPG